MKHSNALRGAEGQAQPCWEAWVAALLCPGWYVKGSLQTSDVELVFEGQLRETEADKRAENFRQGIAWKNDDEK